MGGRYVAQNFEKMLVANSEDKGNGGVNYSRILRFPGLSPDVHRVLHPHALHGDFASAAQG